MNAFRSIGLALALAATRAAAQTPSADPAGDWRATLTVGPSKIRLVLHLGAQSTFDSPDQGANGLPAQMTVADGKVTVILRGAGRFEGAVSTDGRTLTGALVQGPSSIGVTFERGTFAAANRPQTPKPPFPYRSEDIAYDNPNQAGVHLSGTLTIPAGKGPFPVVLLITGSGTQDRDETLFEHKPFLVLADALTRRGVAVLRLDDRGIGGSHGGLPNPTTADFASDVEAGVAWLKTRPGLDPKRIGLLGHSEGGLIAPMVAAKDPSIAFILLWAGPGINGKEVIIDQARTITLASGGSAEAAKKNADLQHALMDALLTAPDRSAAKIAMNAVAAGSGGPAVSDASVALMSSPWYVYFMKLDPAVALRQVKVPTLALLGGKDTQVSPQANEAALRAALAGNKKATIEVLPGLNHMFQMAGTGAPSEYGDIEQTLDPSALDRMVGWITSVSKAKR
ncbi:MAG: alpha/beta fold hydrolase [Sphingobium sp.]|nr:alpha/beta fold hydrolase [Sphingobium sp.]